MPRVVICVVRFFILFVAVLDAYGLCCVEGVGKQRAFFIIVFTHHLFPPSSSLLRASSLIPPPSPPLHHPIHIHPFIFRRLLCLISVCRRGRSIFCRRWSVSESRRRRRNNNSGNSSGGDGGSGGEQKNGVNGFVIITHGYGEHCGRYVLTNPKMHRTTLHSSKK